MVIIKFAKILIVGFTTIPMAFGALSCGVLFGSLILAGARNPEESDKLYGTSLTAFALIESFSFLAIVVPVVSSINF